MDIPQIQNGLKRLFHQENQRLVFWYDAEGAFEETLPSLELKDITLLRLDQESALEIKIRLEQDDIEGKYLLYAPNGEPNLEEDWLLDIRLYSCCFYADPVSIWLDELGLKHMALRTHLNKRQKFLSNQKRLLSLKKWVQPQDQERELDLKILMHVVGADKPEWFAIVIKLLSGFYDKDDVSLERVPKAWQDIEKYDLTEAFWEIIEETFGYNSDRRPEEAPSLKNFLIRLLVTDFEYQRLEQQTSGRRSNETASLRHLILPNGATTANTVILLSQWRENLNHYQYYEKCSDWVSEEIQLTNLLQNCAENSLIDVMTFELVEQRVISELRDQLISKTIPPLESVQTIISKRRDGHWANPRLADRENSVQSRYNSIYKALESAAELLSLQDHYKEGFAFPTAEAMAQAYTEELFRLDQLYRLFHEEEDKALLHGGDILKPLKEKIENTYTHRYMDQLALTWGSFVESQPKKESDLLSRWMLSGVTNQQHFFQESVTPILKSAPNSKVFVIISDAFRYEAAEELTRHLNLKNRFQAKLKMQLGVLPSYTSLGMAALLPHKKLTYKTNKNADVLVDGQPTSSLEHRKKILEAHEGTAIKASELMDMKREEGRALAKSNRVIYIYHDTIDAIGDKASTEAKTFNAVRDAIRELSALVRYVINTLSANNLLLTADHGFLFQESKPEIQDKSALEDKPKGTLKAKKRYLLGTNLKDHPKAWHNHTMNTAGAEGNMEFWVPKGANRFHFAGGARFVHGGAMPQEVFVPVISIKQLRGDAAEKSKSRKVDVSLLGVKHKITTNRHRIELVQAEATGKAILPRSLLIGLWDDETLISNEETITFSSESGLMDERKKSLYLLLKSGHYDKKKDYYLITRDTETQAEYQRVTFSINLAFTSDF